MLIVLGRYYFQILNDKNEIINRIDLFICKHKFADKEIYSITDKGRVYFKELMAFYAAGPIPLLFDFNVVITNLNKMDKAEAMELVSTLRQSIQSSAELNEGYAQEFADIPLVGRTIFEQQQLLYNALLEWLNHFEGQFLQE